MHPEYDHLMDDARDEFFVTRTGVIETSDRGLTAEASELGLAPGHWPSRIIAGREFDQSAIFQIGGEVRWVMYTDADGVGLQVFND